LLYFHRSLRTAPGLRGVGKLWEFNDSSLSSAEETISDSEQLVSKNTYWFCFAIPVTLLIPLLPPQMKNKLLKEKLSKPNKKKATKKQISKSKAAHALAKAKMKKAKIKKLKKIVKRSESDKSKDEKTSSDSDDSTTAKKTISKKRKHNSPDIPSDFKDVGVRKRMASLNASAMLAASYAVDKNYRRNSDSSYDSDSSVDIPPAPKKPPEVKHEVEEVSLVLATITAVVENMFFVPQHRSVQSPQTW
jgi:hypothetical protein